MGAITYPAFIELNLDIACVLSFSRFSSLQAIHFEDKEYLLDISPNCLSGEYKPYFRPEAINLWIVSTSFPCLSKTPYFDKETNPFLAIDQCLLDTKKKPMEVVEGQRTPMVRFLTQWPMIFQQSYRLLKICSFRELS